MRPHITSLIFFSFGSLQAQDVTDLTNLSAVNRVPNGANLREVTIPIYDQNQQPTSLLTAAILIKKSDNTLDARDLHLRFLDSSGAIENEITLQDGTYNVISRRLEAKAPLDIHSKDRGFSTIGSSGVFLLQTREALLRGPVTTRLNRSTLNTPDDAHMKSTSALPLLTILPALTAMPAPLSAKEKSEFQKFSTPSPPLTAALSNQEKIEFERRSSPSIFPASHAPELIAHADRTSAAISTAMLVFFQKAGLDHLTLQAVEPAARPTAKPPTVITQEELNQALTPSPNQLVIRASKGCYLDGNAGHIVYLGDIILKGSGLTLTCNQELKLIFDPPQDEPTKTNPSGKKDQLFGDFQGLGELKQIIILGNIEVIGKNKDGQQMGAKADKAIYTPGDDRMILTGKNLVFRNGPQVAFSDDPDAYVTIRPKQQTIHAEGDLRFGVPTDDLKKN